MKLKNLKSIGHNAAHSYFSALSHIGQKYTCTLSYRFALQNGLSQLELNVLNQSVNPIQNTEIEYSLLEFRHRFVELLDRENIPVEAVSSYKLIVDRIGERIDVINLRGKPEIVDVNGKIYVCAEIWAKYPEPI